MGMVYRKYYTQLFNRLSLGKFLRIEQLDKE